MDLEGEAGKVTPGARATHGDPDGEDLQGNRWGFYEDPVVKMKDLVRKAVISVNKSFRISRFQNVITSVFRV